MRDRTTRRSRSSQLAAGLILLAAAVCPSFLPAQIAPQVRHSTHDWTLPAPDPNYNEGWADVKAPGDGRTYTVGTIEVSGTSQPAFFSLAPAFDSGSFFVPLPAPQVRQVAMLQVTDGAQGIAWQRYFHGSTGPGASLRPTNARGVSVYPAPDPEDTRVVICGESFDQILPLSQVPNGWPSAAATPLASGFIAVFDGNGFHLWSHHLFGPPEAVGECAVTDVSVRIEFDAEGVPVRDVITYCGISSFGNPAGASPLSTIAPFAAPAACATAASGASDNGPRQWDGFVGRIARDHLSATPTTTVFHSVVGGNQQDGLFGLSECDENHFVVVGSTAGGRAAAAVGVGAAEFPFVSPGTIPPCAGAAPSTHCVGTVLVFDAGQTPANALLLVDSLPIGSRGEVNTIARDVLAQRNGPELFNVYYVGSTTDATLMQLLSLLPFGGGSDGFVLMDTYVPSTPLIRLAGRFQGGEGDGGWTGVTAWNEFADHVVVGGFVDLGQNPDMDVLSLYHYAGAYSPPVPFQLVLPLTGQQIGGGGDDLPTAMGNVELTSSGGPLPAASPLFATFGLGNHAGGGVSQDKDGRVNLVGRTTSSDFPVTATTATTVAGRARIPNLTDAVRSVVDLLPATVARTDGTGSLAAGFPGAGVDGGTTPPCARNDFGYQIGRPGPQMARMLMDYEGPTPGAGVQGNFVVLRPDESAGYVAAALRVGFPGAGNQPLLLADGIEIWTFDPDVFEVFVPGSLTAFRSPPVLFPAAPFSCTVQIACLLPAPIPAGNPTALIPCATAGTTVLAVSPAIFLSY